MGSKALENVRSAALDLPQEERAELAYTLIASFDGPVDPEAEKAWESEILRRISEIEAGTARLIDREELSRRLRNRMAKVRK